MTPPMPPAAAPASDRTTLWGVLGIVFSVCCPILGIVFSVLSLLDARKVNKPPTLAYIAFAIAALNILGNIVWAATGHGFVFNRR